MTSPSIWACVTLASLTSQAEVITPSIQVLGYNNGAPYGACPGTWTYDTHIEDGKFYIAFNPSPTVFHIKRDSAFLQAVRCSATVQITMPNLTCYTLDEVLVTGEMNVVDGNTLALIPQPLSYIFDPRSNSWAFESKFTTDMHVIGPGQGTFLEVFKQFESTNNKQPLSKCGNTTRLDLQLELGLRGSVSHSTADTNMFLYSFKTSRIAFRVDPPIRVRNGN
jgi:hypothetical protein